MPAIATNRAQQLLKFPVIHKKVGHYLVIQLLGH
jgi:hypothetical protein